MSTRDYDGWCIVTADGVLLVWTCQPTRVRSIAAFRELLASWRSWRRYGYRCVRVKVTEVQR